MLTFPAALKIYLAVEPVDMRKQFNGLWALAEQKLTEDPKQGAVFVFTNRSRDWLKMLYWDGTRYRFSPSGSSKVGLHGQWAVIARSSCCSPTR